MRYSLLYLRDRRVPLVFVAMVASIGAIGLFFWLDGGVGPDVVLGTLALAVGAGTTAVSLCAMDGALERTAAISLPPRRAAQVLVAVGVLIGLLLVLDGVGLRLVPAEMVVRDAFGLMGLAALGAALLGGNLAWVLPTTWGVVAALTGSAFDTTLARTLTWPVQQPGTTAATVTAVFLGVGGTAVYVIAGGRR